MKYDLPCKISGVFSLGVIMEPVQEWNFWVLLKRECLSYGG